MTSIPTDRIFCGHPVFLHLHLENLLKVDPIWGKIITKITRHYSSRKFRVTPSGPINEYPYSKIGVCEWLGSMPKYIFWGYLWTINEDTDRHHVITLREPFEPIEQKRVEKLFTFASFKLYLCKMPASDWFGCPLLFKRRLYSKMRSGTRVFGYFFGFRVFFG